MGRINKIATIEAPINKFDVSYTDGSTANGVHKPIIFKYLRIDYNIGATYTDDGLGYTQVTGFIALDFDDIVLGKRLYLCYWNGTDVVKVKSGKVTLVIDTENFVTDIPFVSELGNSGFVNLNEPGWYLKTTINVTFPEVESIEIESTHDSLFYINVNVAPYLKRFIKMGGMLDTYPANGEELEGMAVLYKIDIMPMASLYDYIVNGWLPINVIYTFNVTNFLGINGTKQIQDYYGNSYTDYEAMEETMFLLKNLHKIFIAETPTFFVGFPFWYSHIFKGIYGFRIKPHYTRYNLNGNLISTFTDVESDSSIFNAISINDSLIVAGTKSVVMQLFYHNATDTLQYQKSKTYTIDVVNECTSGGVYLSWLASDGSRYFWLFEKRFLIDIETRTNSDFSPYHENISIQDETERDINISANELITLGTYVPIEKFTWIKTILHSINVKMLMNNDDWQIEGCRWQTVLVERGSKRLNESDDRIVDFSFEIKTAKMNIQSE